MSRQRAAPEPALRALMLLGRWTRVAQSHILQGAPCMCVGALGSLQAADLEQQVLDFLADRYRTRPEVAALLPYAPGDEASSAAGAVADVLRRIARGVDGAPAAGQLDLLRDLERVIESFEEVHGLRGSQASTASPNPNSRR